MIDAVVRRKPGFGRSPNGSRPRQTATMGVVSVAGRSFVCTLGHCGMRSIKREGDGVTPIGAWAFETVYFRADRLLRPETQLTTQAIRPSDAWCDVVGDPNYNRAVTLPYPTIDERLWRDDHVYDICVVLSHNRRPRVQGGGSAIFLHLMRPDYSPTAGCVAMRQADLRFLLRAAQTGSRLIVCG